MSHQAKKHFCLIPFMHTHIEATGLVKACCVSSIHLGNIQNSTIQEIWESDTIKDLRQAFLNDQKDNRCANCHQKEASGNESLRQEVLRKYENRIDELVKHPKPLYFDIRFSNLCTLRCRTCWHGNSSKWFEDAKILNRTISDKAKIKAFESEEVLNEKLAPFFENAVEFYFAGGEPLLMKEHLFVLTQLIEKENYDCFLRYNTNLMNLHQFDQDLTKLWSNFKKIEVLASIDGLGEKGASIRLGIVLKRFEENFRTLKSFPNITLKIAPTLSLLNADLLPNLHQYFFNKNLIGIDDVHFNILHQPYFYNVKSFLKNQKKNIQELFEKHIDWIQYHNGKTDDWKHAIDYMNQDDWSAKYEKAKQETRILNRIRGEDFLI